MHARGSGVQLPTWGCAGALQRDYVHRKKPGSFAYQVKTILTKTILTKTVLTSPLLEPDLAHAVIGRYESIIGTLCDALDALDEPEARAAMVWIIGEYAERIDNADELLESFLEVGVRSACPTLASPVGHGCYTL